MRPIYLVSKTSHHEAEGVIHVPILCIHFLTPLIDFSNYDGIIVTSKQGALALRQYSPDWEKLQVVCVGEATGKEMKALGAQNIEIASGYGESILNTLTGHNEQQKWLYCRPRMIASSWPQRAQEAGMNIDEVIVYETSCNQDMEKIEIAENSVLIFTSPSAIECFLVKYKFLPTHSVIVIGKTTQNALPSGIKSTLSEMITIESCIELAQKLALRETF